MDAHVVIEVEEGSYDTKDSALIPYQSLCYCTKIRSCGEG